MKNYPAPLNFIWAVLGDNDYGGSLLKGLEAFIYDCFDQNGPVMDPRQCKTYLVMFIIGRQGVHWTDLGKPINWDAVRRVGEYLDSKLRVTYERKCPTGDYDGGAAYIDVHARRAYSL